MADHQEPPFDSLDDDEYDEDDYDDDDNDWENADSSAEIAELLVDMLNEKGLTQAMWTRIIAALHEEYYHKFCTCVEVDEVTNLIQGGRP